MCCNIFEESRTNNRQLLHSPAPQQEGYYNNRVRAEEQRVQQQVAGTMSILAVATAFVDACVDASKCECGSDGRMKHPSWHHAKADDTDVGQNTNQGVRSLARWC